jgi:Zn-dependent membrane protease YugP
MMMLAIAIFVLTLGLSLWATNRVKSTFAHYSQIPASSGYTGAECAARILDAAGIHDVEILSHNEMLGDHYDPTNKRLVLSSDNYHGQSTAALGIAAHECGHAIQHKIAYAPLQWRMASVGITTYANMGISYLTMFGFMGNFLHGQTAIMLLAACWGVVMLFNLITLPVEFDASRRAKVVLGKMNFIRPGDEANAVKKVLDVAGWTYVAAFLTSLLWFLFYLLPLLMGGRRDD